MSASYPLSRCSLKGNDWRGLLVNKMKNNFMYDDEDNVVVYVDGACRGNGQSWNKRKAGIGVWFGWQHSMNASEALPGRQTNIRAEIWAAKRSVEIAEYNGIYNLRIFTDCRFVIDAINCYIYDWRRNGWWTKNNYPVISRDELEALDEAINSMDVVEWSHVYGHSGNKGNEQAHRLATLAATRKKST
ncbi:unnamed protein product [Allacma fusca]|uniref:ribonuclease H n=1 Tax=Allacma fusca TaxID=39272 RepID=A0A8J2JTA1_9HEXA|nr:unnamed protein product [Allacma fusca]